MYILKTSVSGSFVVILRVLGSTNITGTNAVLIIY